MGLLKSRRAAPGPPSIAQAQRKPAQSQPLPSNVFMTELRVLELAANSSNHTHAWTNCREYDASIWSPFCHHAFTQQFRRFREAPNLDTFYPCSNSTPHSSISQLSSLAQTDAICKPW